MQGLTAAPRDGLTAAQVTALLTGPTLSVSAGLELLNSDLTFSADISDDLAGGSVDRVMDAKVHQTCKLTLSRALAWGTALVRPYMVLTGSGVTARFNVGVYSLATPQRKVGLTPETYEVIGYDRLYLLDRGVGDTYSVTAGTDYLTAARSAITAAGLSGVTLDTTATGKTLPADRVWPLLDAQNNSTTWLQIVNDLLSAVGYRGLYCDENGYYKSEPYQDPAVRGVEFTLDADSNLTIVGDDRTYTEDIWAVPNSWVFLQQNPPTGTAPAVYRVSNPSTGPTSILSRGLTWVKTVQLDAADSASLTTLGDVIVAADKRVPVTLTVTTGPLPIAGHRDVLAYTDTALGSARKVQAARWSLDLTGADMSWVLEVLS